MKKFEYRTVGVLDQGVELLLNEAGAEGWDVIYTKVENQQDQDRNWFEVWTLLLKREIPDA